MTTKTTGIKNGSRRAEFERLALLETDDCIEWPFAKNTKGYGLIWIDGRVRTIHSVVCERHNGDRPTGYHAAHHCGNKPCMNHRHIRWATPSENERDKRIHGTHTGGPLNRRRRRPMTWIHEDGTVEIIGGAA